MITVCVMQKVLTNTCWTIFTTYVTTHRFTLTLEDLYFIHFKLTKIVSFQSSNITSSRGYQATSTYVKVRVFVGFVVPTASNRVFNLNQKHTAFVLVSNKTLLIAHLTVRVSFCNNIKSTRCTGTCIKNDTFSCHISCLKHISRKNTVAILLLHEA